MEAGNEDDISRHIFQYSSGDFQFPLNPTHRDCCRKIQDLIEIKKESAMKLAEVRKAYHYSSHLYYYAKSEHAKIDWVLGFHRRQLAIIGRLRFMIDSKFKLTVFHYRRFSLCTTNET